MSDRFRMIPVSALTLAVGLFGVPAGAQTFVGTPGGSVPGATVQVNLDVLNPASHSTESLAPVVLLPPSQNAGKVELAAPLAIGVAPAVEILHQEVEPKRPAGPTATAVRQPEKAPAVKSAGTGMDVPGQEKAKPAKGMPKRLPGSGSGHLTSTPTSVSEPFAPKVVEKEVSGWPSARKTAVDGAIEAEALRNALAKAREQMGDKKSLPPASALAPSPDHAKSAPKPNAIDGALKAAVLREATEKAAEIRSARNKGPENAKTPDVQAIETVVAPASASSVAAVGGAPAKASVEPVKTVSPAAVAMVKPNNLKILFEGSASDIAPEYNAQMDAVITWLQKNETARLQIEAYASSPDGQINMARRISLSRALAIRSYLIDRNIRSTRIDVRAKGDATTEEPLDRVDLIISE